MHLASGILGGETPVDGGSGLVSLCLSGADVPLQGILIGVSSLETGPSQYAELNLGHVQPASMLGRVVELQPLCGALGLSRRVGLVEGRHSMSVQIDNLRVAEEEEGLTYGFREALKSVCWVRGRSLMRYPYACIAPPIEHCRGHGPDGRRRGLRPRPSLCHLH